MHEQMLSQLGRLVCGPWDFAGWATFFAYAARLPTAAFEVGDPLLDEGGLMFLVERVGELAVRRTFNADSFATAAGAWVETAQRGAAGALARILAGEGWRAANAAERRELLVGWAETSTCNSRQAGGAVVALAKWAEDAYPPRMDDQSEHPKLRQIRALLAKAESTDFAEEADALMDKAQELMDRYAVDAAQLDATRTGLWSPTCLRIDIDAPYVMPKASLLNAVAKGSRCQVVATAEAGYAELWGFPDDVELVEMLFTSLLVQAEAALNCKTREARTQAASVRGYRQSFLLAFASRVAERFADRSRAVFAHDQAGGSGGSLLPELASRVAAVDAAIAPTLVTCSTKKSTISSVAGMVAGRQAGDRAVLDTRLGKAAPNALLAG
jgi:hypothetical protein